MALSQEQLNNLEYHTVIESSRREHETAMEKRRAKLEVIRLAKETLIENRRNLPSDQRVVLPEDVTFFAQTLMEYIEN